MKRLIVCSDGTWQDLETDYPTNVVKLVQAVTNRGEDGRPQIVFYDAGVGTGSKWDKVVGGALGKGIDKNILDCYRFLILNYEPGDEVYLFGFSRGSYTVRSLAGLIYCCGLPTRENIRTGDEAYALYRNRKIYPSHKIAGKFRNKHSKQHIDITLLACWDTVGALGVPGWFINSKRLNKKYQFHDTMLNPRIRNALHAVSVDERRGAFNVTPMDKYTGVPDQQQTLQQTWFAGDHGCIGGGGRKKAGLSDITLRWMIDEIKACGLGLSFNVHKIEGGIKMNHKTPFNNKLTRKEKLLFGVAVRNVTGGLKDIHQTVKRRWRDCPGYRPANLAGKLGPPPGKKRKRRK